MFKKLFGLKKNRYFPETPESIKHGKKAKIAIIEFRR